MGTAGSGHFRPNLSNPFNGIPPGPPSSTNSHFGHQSSLSNFAHQGISGPGLPSTFGAPSAHQNGHGNIFGSVLTNGVGGFNGDLRGTVGPGMDRQEARMGFNRGIQQEEAVNSGTAYSSTTPRGASRIREVWKHNLDQEMAVIRGLLDKYPYVGMDTEFPGIVARPMGTFASKADYHYQTLRTNVNALKLIQLGITLFNADGENPPAQPETPLLGRSQANSLTPCPTTWQFNFHFDRNQDMCAEESLRLLSNAGIDFDRHVENGIDHMDFGSLLITSGLVLDPTVKWLSFHSGYDFGYLLKIMSQTELPNEHEQFMKLLTKWFPHVIDIKFLWKDAQRRSNRGLVNTTVSDFLNALGYKSGLEDLAVELGCRREGRAHTAGSDAWLTGSTYWPLREKVFDGVIPGDLVGQLWGLSGVPPPASAATHAAFAGSQTPNTNGATLYHHQTGMTPSTIRTSEGPATPQGAQSSLASNTPGTNNMGYSNAGAGGMGLTGGGAFSNFQYGR